MRNQPCASCRLVFQQDRIRVLHPRRRPLREVAGESVVEGCEPAGGGGGESSRGSPALLAPSRRRRHRTWAETAHGAERSLRRARGRRARDSSSTSVELVLGDRCGTSGWGEDLRAPAADCLPGDFDPSAPQAIICPLSRAWAGPGLPLQRRWAQAWSGRMAGVAVRKDPTEVKRPCSLRQETANCSQGRFVFRPKVSL